jgi:hypothetical protein
MKNQLLLFGFVLLTCSLFAQNESTFSDQKWRWGFSLGSNLSQLTSQEKIPAGISIKNDMGFRMGISSDFRFSKYFSISPKAELSFNSGRYQFNSDNQFMTDYAVLPISLDFMTHFTFYLPGEKRSPYIYVGPNYRMGIEDKDKVSITYSAKSHFAFDIGFGFERIFPNFIIAPELRYSLGLEEANNTETLPSTRVHNFALILQFKG